MILLYLVDTNVLSEATRPRPNPQVLNQLVQHQNEIATAAVVWHEFNSSRQGLPQPGV